MKRYHSIFLLLSFLFIVRCKQPYETTDRVQTTVIVSPELVNEEVADLIEQQLNSIDTLTSVLSGGDSICALKQVKEVYEQNNFEPIWTNNGKHLPQYDSLFVLIKNSANYRLMSKDYHFQKISQSASNEYDSVSKKFNATAITETELLLTDAFFTLAVHLNKGRLNSETLEREWKLNQVDTNLIQLFSHAFRNNQLRQALDSLEPQSKPYQALKRELNRFLYEFKDVTWDSLFKQGMDTTTFNERLKQRLIASHDYVFESGVNKNTLLTNAIKNIQCRHQLEEDGKIGPLTYKVLQQSKQDYINKIEMNMERWRWQNPPEDERYVWINIPNYELRVIEQDTVVIQSKVIVGNPKTPTPQLKSTVRYFIIYPYWTVPHSIATKEILPKLKTNPAYLHKERFDVLDRQHRVIQAPVSWKKYNKNYFPFYLRQRIGDDNSLGVLKFDFNNKYGVYLHDTNNHKLFKKQNRALSHGCVRIEEFETFAKFLIREDSVRYPSDSLMVDLLREKQKYVYLKKPIPIYINYYTAEVDKNEELFYFIDVYRKDEKMLKALEQK